MLKMMVMFQQALWTVKNQKGAVAIEYGLLVAVVACGLIVAMQTLTNGVSGFYNQIITKIQAFPK